MVRSLDSTVSSSLSLLIGNNDTWRAPFPTCKLSTSHESALGPGEELDGESLLDNFLAAATYQEQLEFLVDTFGLVVFPEFFGLPL